MNLLIGTAIGIIIGSVMSTAIILLVAFRSFEKEELSKEDWKAGYRQK